jgi:hypothetical protein
MDTEVFVAPSEAVIRDGFEEICTYSDHQLKLKGLIPVEVFDRSTQSVTKPFDHFISWDARMIRIWMCSRDTGDVETVRTSRSNGTCTNSLTNAITYVSRQKCFLVSCADQSMKIYDRSFKLLESIKHNEGAILNMQQVDEHNSDILMSGARGVSNWALSKKLSAHNFELEKKYTFSGTTALWVSKFQYDTSTKCLYALVETAVYILSLESQGVVEVVDSVHTAPITCCLWYQR